MEEKIKQKYELKLLGPPAYKESPPRGLRKIDPHELICNYIWAESDEEALTKAEEALQKYAEDTCRPHKFVQVFFELRKIISVQHWEYLARYSLGSISQINLSDEEN